MPKVRLNWTFLSLALLVAVLTLSAGCSGINATGRASPATFFLPGLMKAEPPSNPERTVPVEEPGTEVAQF